MSDSLRQLQLRFKAYLQQDDPAIHDDVIGSDNAEAEHRLAAYWNAYRLRLIEALANDFEKLHLWMGDEAFEALILDYIAAHPSRHRSIRWVGQQLPDFLQRRGEPFLSELAAFEWSLGLCFDAPESTSRVSLDDMARLSPQDWPGLVFHFEPSMRWLDLQWNAVAVWQALDNDDPLPRAERAEYPLRWLLWRQEHDLRWRSLEVAEAWAIEAAHQATDFAALCEGLLEWHGEEQVTIEAAGFIRQWLHDGLIARIEQR